ncbi:MAG: TIGR03960 family B12-binding radical SAM protein [Ruminococcaceae bacterium]|nr:TIGR03960 family B12-binding radical SAM protein [Oscillospiraceae bacterium]
MVDFKKYEPLLEKVEKPGRYVGNEYSSEIPDPASAEIRACFCFPDTYEIGMSNLGIKILSGCFNNSGYISCERCYMPWPDMKQQLEEHGYPLYALESGDPLNVFDLVAFTLQYELSYTNVVAMLGLGGIPLLSKDRSDSDPIVIAGGPCAYNPEPIADFIDIFSIGEGEEALLELTALMRECKKTGVGREELLYRASQLEGFYVPSLYDVEYNSDGTIKSFAPNKEGVPAKVKKRIIEDLDKVYFPCKCSVPFLETVHDRVMLEVFRGCIRGCRFCQAGMIYRPYREKSPDVLNNNALEAINHTGYSEISLTSLSISDYTHLRELINSLLSWTDDKKVNLSLPSMRIDNFYEELLEKVSSVRKSGLTFAPEAGTQRLRDVINKNITEEEIITACEKAFDGGRNSLKLYFMNGLPTETDEDICGIASLGQNIVNTYYSKKRFGGGRGVNVTVSVSCFVPKPFTPFQWEPQDSLEELERKQQLLKSEIKTKKISYKYHDARVSRIEAVFARGDRRLGKALLEAYNRGIVLDGWDEYFSYNNWISVFDACGIDPAFYANRRFGTDEILPWDFIDIGVTKKFMLKEYEKSKMAETTPDCRTKCSGCGAKSLCGGKCVCDGGDDNG